MLAEKEEPGHGGFDEEKWTIADGLRPALERATFDLIRIWGSLIASTAKKQQTGPTTALCWTRIRLGPSHGAVPSCN